MCCVIFCFRLSVRTIIVCAFALSFQLILFAGIPCRYSVKPGVGREAAELSFCVVSGEHRTEGVMFFVIAG